MAAQRFQLVSTAPGLPPEVGCAGCHAVMSEDPVPVPSDTPANAMIMDHADGCSEVARLSAG